MNSQHMHLYKFSRTGYHLVLRILSSIVPRGGDFGSRNLSLASLKKGDSDSYETLRVSSKRGDSSIWSFLYIRGMSAHYSIDGALKAVC